MNYVYNLQKYCYDKDIIYAIVTFRRGSVTVAPINLV